MRPTPASRALFTRTPPPLMSRTKPVWSNSSASHANHYIIAYQKMHDHDLSALYPPGTPDPRSKYWWRRLYTFLIGPQVRFFQKDNIFPEEQAIVFRDPVPGGHGDRFTHHWNPYPGENWRARQVMQKWEVDNLTPEQLAAKYGIYIPRIAPEEAVFAFGIFFTWWLFLLISTYYDNELAFVTHPVLDDFIRELGGIQPLSEDEAHLEQWVHPYYHMQFHRKVNPHWSWKPIALANTKQE